MNIYGIVQKYFFVQIRVKKSNSNKGLPRHSTRTRSLHSSAAALRGGGHLARSYNFGSQTIGQFQYPYLSILSFFLSFSAEGLNIPSFCCKLKQNE